MRSLSKSKILAYRQCTKRLWLELHRSDLKDDSGSETAYRIGNEIGEVARLIYDESGTGVFVDLDELGFDEAFARSERLLREGGGPVFEAGLKMPSALAFADVMLPDTSDGSLRWRMIEVKSAAGIKDYYREDIAVQAYVAEGAVGSIARFPSSVLSSTTAIRSTRVPSTRSALCPTSAAVAVPPSRRSGSATCARCPTSISRRRSDGSAT